MTATVTAQANKVRPALVLLLLVQFVLVLNDTVVYVALPPMTRALNLSTTQVTWVMNAYMLGLGGFLLVGGYLADRFERRGALAVALLAFAAASAVCALATSPAVLIAGRAGQGLAGALAAPAAMALVADLYPPGPERYKAIGLFGGIGGVAGATGSLIGGGLVNIGWQYVFAVSLPLILLAVAGLRLLPTGRPSAARAPAPVATAALGVTGICLLLLAAARLAEHAPTTVTVAMTVGGMLATAGLVVRQRASKAPLIPPALLTARPVVVANLVNACTGFILFGGFLVLTLYLQDVAAMPPMLAAAWLLPISLALFAGSQAGIRAIPQLGPRRVMLSAALLQSLAATAWVLAPADAPWATGAILLLPGIIWGAGLGLGIVAGFGAATHDVPGPLQGAASGLVNTALQVGGALGVTATGLIALTGGPPTTATIKGALVAAGLVAAASAALSTRLPAGRP